MDSQNRSLNNTVTVQVEMDALGGSGADQVPVTTIMQSAMESLRKGGYQVRPVYTGERSASVFEIILDAAEQIWSNKEFFLALSTSIASLVRHVADFHEVRGDKVSSGELPTISLEIDGDAISLDVPTGRDAAALQEILVSRDLGTRTSPAQSRVKVQVLFSPKPRRPRR